MSKVRIAAALLLVAGGALWAQFYAAMEPARRVELAEDYYLAAQQYKAVGLLTKGQEFEDLAFWIYPGLDPAAIYDPTPISISEYLASADVRVLGPPEAEEKHRTRAWGRWYQTDVPVDGEKAYGLRVWVKTSREFGGKLAIWVTGDSERGTAAVACRLNAYIFINGCRISVVYPQEGANLHGIPGRLQLLYTIR